MENKYPRLTVIAQVADVCNLECIYCSADHGSQKGIMKLETMENMLRTVAQYNKNSGLTHIIWHGGEPTFGECFIIRFIW